MWLSVSSSTLVNEMLCTRTLTCLMDHSDGFLCVFWLRFVVSRSLCGQTFWFKCPLSSYGDAVDKTWRCDVDAANADDATTATGVNVIDFANDDNDNVCDADKVGSLGGSRRFRRVDVIFMLRKVVKFNDGKRIIVEWFSCVSVLSSRPFSYFCTEVGIISCDWLALLALRFVCCTITGNVTIDDSSVVSSVAVVVVGGAKPKCSDCCLKVTGGKCDKKKFNSNSMPNEQNLNFRHFLPGKCDAIDFGQLFFDLWNVVVSQGTTDRCYQPISLIRRWILYVDFFAIFWLVAAFILSYEFIFICPTKNNIEIRKKRVQNNSIDMQMLHSPNQRQRKR